MKKFTVLSFLFCARFLSAQNPGPTPIGSDAASAAFRQMEIFERTVKEASQEQINHTAENRAAQYERQQFLLKANHFVTLWQTFVTEVNEKQTFDAKLARKLSKAFHELETSDGWPVPTGDRGIRVATK